mgnify:CR=1 FL=1
MGTRDAALHTTAMHDSHVCLLGASASFYRSCHASALPPLESDILIDSLCNGQQTQHSQVNHMSMHLLVGGTGAGQCRGRPWTLDASTGWSVLCGCRTEQEEEGGGGEKKPVKIVYSDDPLLNATYIDTVLVRRLPMLVRTRILARNVSEETKHGDRDGSANDGRWSAPWLVRRFGSDVRKPRPALGRHLPYPRNREVAHHRRRVVVLRALPVPILDPRPLEAVRPKLRRDVVAGAVPGNRIAPETLSQRVIFL